MKSLDSIIFKYSLALLCAAFAGGCGEEGKLGLDKVDDVAPAPPTVVGVENINGGAIITFTAPKEDDLLCVVATYTINGVERFTKASPYVNKLTVEGFGKVGDYTVRLTRVDKSRNESPPVSVTVSPLKPPVEFIFESLKIVDSFGGIKMTWENPTESNIIIEVARQDGEDWISLENVYTSARVGSATIRGLDPEPVLLSFRVRDRWDNYSETMSQESNPLPESLIDKSLFREVDKLPGDCNVHGSLPIRNIWNGIVNQSECFHSNDPTNIGQCITFDMGQRAKLSRFKMFQRLSGNSWMYTHNNLKRYTIYGCDELTSEMYNGGVVGDDGLTYPTFEGWRKIMDVECYKPSGADSGVITNEDAEYIRGGDEHEVPIEAEPFRYVRILMLETWSGGIYTQIGEMTFWGQVVQ